MWTSHSHLVCYSKPQSNAELNTGANAGLFNKSSTDGMEGSIISIFCTFPKYSDTQTWANSVDPVQTPQNVLCNQGLYCKPPVSKF